VSEVTENYRRIIALWSDARSTAAAGPRAAPIDA
jgi:hypothetical protein